MIRLQQSALSLARISVLVITASLCCFGALGGVSAFPSSYAREHPEECADARAKSSDWRLTCVDRAWCAQHRNDDPKNRIACDPYESRAIAILPSVTVTQGWLNAARDLTDAETRIGCGPDQSHRDKTCSMSWLRGEAGKSDDRLLPNEMKAARLALRADISVYVFQPTVVRLGVGGGGTAWIEVTWNLNGNGPRQTQSARLNPAEIDHLLAALNRSNFWRLPHEGHHLGPTDGELAAVEVSVPGWKNEAMDAIGDADAVDLSVLVNAISTIIHAHWRDVPGG